MSDLMNIKEAAEYLGVTRQTVYAWMKRPGFPVNTVFDNGRKLISKIELNAWLKRNSGLKEPFCPITSDRCKETCAWRMESGCAVVAMAKLASSGDGGIIAGVGIDNKAKGAIGCWIVLAEWRRNQNHALEVHAVKAAKVDGENLKPDTWYMLKDGEFVACEEVAHD